MRTCMIDGCTQRHYARGWCRTHYEQSKRGQEPGPVAQYTDETGTCASPDCDVTFLQRQWGSKRLYCSRRCASRVAMTKKRDAGYIPPHKRDGQPRCKVDGCEKGRMAQGLCTMHYTRLITKGEVGPAESEHRPGEWRTNANGYVERFINGATQFQHRHVTEQLIGRPLYPFENVHHRNGIRGDNSPENLELWTKPQLAGQRVEDLVAWVVEYYPEQVLEALKNIR